jgi:ABC-type branched-subunit amino acid transport system ATPase component
VSPEPILEARKIVKSFGRVQALNGANFTVFPQEVVALVGDNGAGKSTLVKTLVGVHPPDSGEILFEGERVVIHTPRQARAIGIETVYQDLEAGALHALIAHQPPDIGAQGVQQAYKALTGKSTTGKIGTESVSITKHSLSQIQDSRCKA